MDNTTVELSKAFPPESIRQLSKAGRSLDYIPVSEVIARLNSVLGTENWSYTAECHREPIIQSWIVAHVSMSVTVNGTTSTKDGYGGAEFKEDGRGMDLADTYKAAVSEGLKKAAQAFGVGLHLARDEDMIALEEAQVAQSEPISAEYFAKLSAQIEKLEVEEAALVMDFWDHYSEGAEFSRENINSKQLLAIIQFMKDPNAR